MGEGLHAHGRQLSDRPRNVRTRTRPGPTSLSGGRDVEQCERARCAIAWTHDMRQNVIVVSNKILDFSIVTVVSVYMSLDVVKSLFLLSWILIPEWKKEKHINVARGEWVKRCDHIICNQNGYLYSHSWLMVTQKRLLQKILFLLDNFGQLWPKPANLGAAEK